MTENKRFKLIWRNDDFEPFQKRVICDDKFKREYNCTFKHQEELCNLLNELYEDLEGTTGTAHNAIEAMQVVMEDNVKLEKENKTLKKENQRLKAQLYVDDEGVCNICQHQYLIKTDKDYYVARCKKEHEECSKETVKHCEDFRIVEIDIND